MQALVAGTVDTPLSYDDVVKALSHSEDLPVCVVIELPHRELGGRITSWEDLQRISELCRSKGIAMHMDGARLWEAAAGYERSASELCALFDSVYVSFYKGLGGLSGAMLLGGDAFCASARVWLRRFGGNVFSLMPLSLSAWIGFREHRDDFVERRKRLREVVSAISTALSLQHDHDGDVRPLMRFEPEEPVVSLVHVHMHATAEQCVAAQAEASAECGIACFARLRQSSLGAAYFEFNMVIVIVLSIFGVYSYCDLCRDH